MCENVSSATELPLHLQSSAFSQYEETNESRRRAILELRSSIKSLPEEDQLNDLSDENLIRFIRNRKFDLQKALDTTAQLKKFYTKHKALLSGLDGSIYKKIHDIHGFEIIKNLDRQGRVILLPNFGIITRNITPEYLQANPNYILRMHFWLMDRLSRDPDVQVNGLILLASFKGMGFFDVLGFSNMISIAERKIMVKHMSHLAIRLKVAHFFEVPFAIQGIFAIIKPFLSKKLSNRFNLRGDDYEDVLPELLGAEGWTKLRQHWPLSFDDDRKRDNSESSTPPELAHQLLERPRSPWNP